VQVNPGDPSRAGPNGEKWEALRLNNKSLSGGEKSFATVCFLLALWEVMDSPIRCLDEFDVFQDDVNRRISINLLVAAAAKGNQYLIISPKGLDIARTNEVGVIELDPPERGQRTLQESGMAIE